MASDPDALVGANARRIRNASGLSLGDVCDRINAETGLGWVEGTLSKIESGARRLRVPELAVLCMALEVPAGALLDGDDFLDNPWEGWTGRRMAAALEGENVRTRTRGREDDRVAVQRRKRLVEQLEHSVLRALGLTLDELDELREVVELDYGRDLLEEREARIKYATDMVYGPRGLSTMLNYAQQSGNPGEVAKYRAHATREIIAELRDSYSWQTITFTD